MERHGFVESFEGKDRRKNWRLKNIIGRDVKMLDIFEKIAGVAATDSLVLITGETGTGKELAAEAIHFESPRKSGPLVRVNCAAFTESLVTSELFGHEKGSFSGAIALKKGCFERAGNGSIFLDEIGDIPVRTQSCLLRVLESRTFQRVGGSESLNVDARIICGTNKNLWHEVKQKRFREDLFYRINVVPIHLPPLRQRKTDIPLLASYFLKRYADQNGKEIRRISGPAVEMLLKHDWPGNVRELANAVEQAVVFCKKRKITPVDLPRKLHEGASSKPFALTLTSRSLPQAEAALIVNVLEEFNWNLKQAAEKLDIARGTLYSKIKKHGIAKPFSVD
ncbi:MAG: sigma-54 dependent transcriptional regulator [Desulfobacterales bacterium]